jgi:hypothetical protein
MVAEPCSQAFVDPAQRCQSDADCKAPAQFTTLASSCVQGQCSADTCHTDADCGDTGVCSCQGQTFGWSHSSFGNSCVASNCRTNADCASGLCAPSISFDSGPFYGIQGYYCTTPDDACECDADCPVNGYCAFDPTAGKWACGDTHIAG